MVTKLKILTIGLAIAATVAFAAGDTKEAIKAIEECKKLVEQGATTEYCSALLSTEKKDCDRKKDFGDKKDFKKEGKSFDKKDEVK